MPGKNNLSRKMQNVRFRHIDELLEFLPGDELRLVNTLRQLARDCLPKATEQLSFNVPYYKGHKMICFIWPASVLWGKKKTYEGVRFGFTYGHLLQDEAGYLEKGDRKQVLWRDFIRLTDEDIRILKAYLYEAALLDEAMKKSRGNKK